MDEWNENCGYGDIKEFGVGATFLKMFVGGFTDMLWNENCGYGDIKEFGVGATFLKMFVGGFTDMLFVPAGLEVGCVDVGKIWFLVTCGGSSRSYKVLLQQQHNRLVFTVGWRFLVATEGICQGNVGHFARTSGLKFVLTVYSRGGLEVGTVAPRLCGVSDRAAGGGPGALEDVRFELGPGMHRSVEVVSALQVAWSSPFCPFILYATILKESHIQYGNMWFTKKFSLSMLEDDVVALKMVFNGSGLVHCGRMSKRGDRIARITHGWKEFAKAHEMKAESVYVFSFRKMSTQGLGLVVSLV